MKLGIWIPLYYIQVNIITNLKCDVQGLSKWCFNIFIQLFSVLLEIQVCACAYMYITSYINKLSFKFHLDRTIINTEILRINVLHSTVRTTLALLLLFAS